MTYLNDLGRRSFLKIAAALGSASTAVALPNIAGARDAALSKLDAQFGALFHTQDFLEGQKAEAEGRKPVYHGK